MSQSGVSNPVNHSATPTLADSPAAAAHSDRFRRQFLVAATTTVGVVRAVLAAWPFVASRRPSARARTLGSSVQLKMNRIEPGQRVTVTWRGQLVWVSRRSPEMLERPSHDHWLRDLFDPDTFEIGVDHAAA